MSDAKHGKPSSVAIEKHVRAPGKAVGRFIGDFRHARDWMAGVEAVEKLSEERYRLTLESPVGTLEPEVRITEHNDHRIRWEYDSVIEGGGEVTVAEADGDASACLVFYRGEFALRSRILNRAARLVGMEKFAHRNGERSLLRLKHLMEARRYR